MQRITTDATTAVETIPPIAAVPSAATCRITQPNINTPVAFSSCDVDDTAAVAEDAAAQGATSIAITQPSAEVITDTESSTLLSVTNPQTVATTTLEPLTAYDVTVTFSLFLVSLSETCSGTLTASVTVDGDSITIVSQNTSYTAQGAHLNTVTLSSDGLDLLTVASGDIAGDIQRGGGGVVVTATPSSTPPAFVRGRRYLLSPADGSEPFVVEADEDAGATLRLREPLPKDIGAGSTIDGITMGVDVTTTTFIGDGLVEWKATVLGRATRWLTPFRIVYRNTTWRLLGTELVMLSPYAAKARPDDDDDYSRCIEAAWTRYVAPALEARHLRTERIVSWAQLNAVHVSAVEMHLAKTYERDPAMRAEKERDFASALSRALESVETWFAPEEPTPSPPDPEAPRFWLDTAIER